MGDLAFVVLMGFPCCAREWIRPCRRIRSCRSGTPAWGRPGPPIDLRLVDAVLVCESLALDLLVAELLLGVRAAGAQRRHPVDRVDREAEAVDLVLDRQVERSID